MQEYFTADMKSAIVTDWFDISFTLYTGTASVFGS